MIGSIRLVLSVSNCPQSDTAMFIPFLSCMTSERALAVHRHGKTWSAHGSMMIHGISRPWSVTWWRFWARGAFTRMALRFQEPSSANCAMDLTSACNACNVHQDVQAMKDRKNTGKNKEPKLLAKQKPSGNQWKLRGNQWKSCKICIIYHSIDGKSLPKKHLFIWPYQNCHGCVINRRPNQLG